MSPPAEKARSPAAVITTRVIAGSSAQSSSCARNASTMPCVTALSACGRLSVTTPAAPRRSKRMSASLTRAAATRRRRASSRLHRLVGEFRARAVAADHEHQDQLRVRIALGHVLETADHAGRKRHHVERPQIDILDLAVLVLPTGAPGAGHRNESLVGVVVVHLGTMTGLGLAVAEVETFADLDRGQPCGVGADRRGHAALADAFRRLEADDVEQRALAAGHLCCPAGRRRSRPDP